MKNLREAVDGINDWQSWLLSNDDIMERFSTRGCRWRVKRCDTKHSVLVLIQRNDHGKWTVADSDGKAYSPSSWADVEMDLGEHRRWNDRVNKKREWYVSYPMAVANVYNESTERRVVEMADRPLEDRVEDASSILKGIAMEGGAR